MRATLLASDATTAPVTVALHGQSDAAPPSLVLVVTDLTEVMRARDALALIVDAQDAIVGKSPDGVVISWNKGAERLYGYTAAEIIGQPIEVLSPPEHRAEISTLIARVKSGEEIANFEIERVKKSGSRMWVSLSLSPVRDSAGAITGISAVERDITKQRDAQMALRLSEERYRSLAHASGQVVWRTGAEGKISADLPSWRAFTGQKVEETLGDGWADALHPADRERTLGAWSRAVQKKSLYDTEYRLRRHDGQYRYVSARATPVLEEDGAVREWIGVCADITERRRAEEELRRLNAELDQRVTERTLELNQVNQDLESFAFSVSHDLRVPLRAIEGFSRILLEDYADKLDAEGQRLLNVVGDSTVKLSRLIDDILTFSRTGRAELRSAPVDMVALVRDTLSDTLARAVAGRKLAINIGALPDAHGDKAMLQRVWINLLDNAIKYTAPKPAARIEIGAAAGRGETVYYVRDDGVGFDMQYAAKLFGVFQRLHGADFPGTGIGLAIVKRIIVRHGGRVWAEGKVGEGATFSFALPIQETCHG